jgi:photosystem II stability/assembly factor-like uncharacterized protein
VAFPTATHGVLLAQDCGSIPGRCETFTRESDDGGLTWSAPVVLATGPWPGVASPGEGSGVGQLVFLNADDGYAYGPDLYQTRDGGCHWRRLAIAGQVGAAAAAGTTVRLVVWEGCGASGCTGWVLDDVDADGQLTPLPIQPRPIPTPPGVVGVELPSQLLAPDPATMYVAGFDTLQVSHDGDAAWARVGFPCQGRYGAADFSTGGSAMLWAVCSSGMGAGQQVKQLWRSTNSGVSWQGPLPLESDGYADQIAAISPEVAWRYGDRGQLLHTADGGRTWQVMLPEDFNDAFGYPSAFAALLDNAWVFDPYGPYWTGTRTLYTTTDAGRTWHTHNVTALFTGPTQTAPASQ